MPRGEKRRTNWREAQAERFKIIRKKEKWRETATALSNCGCLAVAVMNGERTKKANFKGLNLLKSIIAYS